MLWKHLFSFVGLPNNESESAPHTPEQENNKAEVEMSEQLEVTCCNCNRIIEVLICCRFADTVWKV